MLTREPLRSDSFAVDMVARLTCLLCGSHRQNRPCRRPVQMHPQEAKANNVREQPSVSRCAKIVGLMTRLETVFRPIRLKSSAPTFSGTEFVLVNVCHDCWFVETFAALMS